MSIYTVKYSYSFLVSQWENASFSNNMNTSGTWQVDDLLVLEEQLDIDVRTIDTCQYSHSTFAEILNKIQKAVDDLSLHQYSNLHIWVQRLDEQVKMIKKYYFSI